MFLYWIKLKSQALMSRNNPLRSSLATRPTSSPLETYHCLTNLWLWSNYPTEIHKAKHVPCIKTHAALANSPLSPTQIDIDGVPSAKTYSQIRTSTLLYDINLQQNHLITIYAIPCPEHSNPDPIFYTPGCFYYQPNTNNCCRCPRT